MTNPEEQGMERQRFEDHFQRKGWPGWLGVGGFQYRDEYTNGLWSGWQASRQAAAREIADWMDAEDCDAIAQMIRKRYGLTNPRPE